MKCRKLFLFLCLCFVFIQNVSAQQGCCSWHGGVANGCSSSGMQMCNDGTASPTCSCYRNEEEDNENENSTIGWIIMIGGFGGFFAIVYLIAYISEVNDDRKYKREIEQKTGLKTRFLSEESYLIELDKYLNDGIYEEILNDGHLLNIGAYGLGSHIANNANIKLPFYKKMVNVLKNQNWDCSSFGSFIVGLSQNKLLDNDMLNYLMEKNILYYNDGKYEQKVLKSIINGLYKSKNYEWLTLLINHLTNEQVEIESSVFYFLKNYENKDSDLIIEKMKQSENITLVEDGVYLSSALLKKRYDLVDEMNKYFIFDIKSYEGSFDLFNECIRYASYNNLVETIEKILNECKNQKISKTTVERIYGQKNLRVLKMLQDYGVDFDSMFDDKKELNKFRKFLNCKNFDYELFDIRHRREYINNYEIDQAIKQNDIEFIKKIINGNYSLDYHNNDGLTPIFLAIKGKKKEIVEMLIDYNVDLGRISNLSCKENGLTPLIYAIINNCVSIIDVFIEKNVDLNECDDKKNTPIEYASSMGRYSIIKKLLKTGKIKMNEKFENELNYALEHHDFFPLYPMKFIPYLSQRNLYYYKNRKY